MQVGLNPIDSYLFLPGQFPALFKRRAAAINSEGVQAAAREKHSVASAATSKIERPAGDGKAIGEFGKDLTRLDGSWLLAITVVPGKRFRRQMIK